MAIGIGGIGTRASGCAAQASVGAADLADASVNHSETQGSRRISFEQFCKAMEAIASETNTPVKKLFRRIAASSKQPPNANKTGNEAQVHGGDSCPGLSEPLRNMRLKGTPPCAASGNLAPTKPPFAAAPPRARLGPRKSHTFDMSHGPAAPAPPGQMRPSETTQHEADPLASEKDEQSWALQRFAGGKVRPSSAFTSSSHGNSRDSDFSRARDGSERPKDADDVMFHVKCTYLAYCQARASIKESGFNGIGLQRPAMHGSTFARLCRQCKLTSTKHGSLSLACVDNIFKKVKQQVCHP